MSTRLTASQKAAIDVFLAEFEGQAAAEALDDALAAIETTADTGGLDYSPDPDEDRAYQAGWSDAIAACASEVASLA